MRHRRKKWQTDILLKDYSFYIKEPSLFKGKWNKDNKFEKLHVEIGSGKGQYIYEMAKLFPQDLFIAIEVMPLIGSYILKKLVTEPLDNVLVIIQHAESLTDWFAQSEIDIIHLNFSDPWPKKAHEKRRLTHSTYLDIYKMLLKKEGEIQQKTDNIDFFEYSMVEFSTNHFICIDFSADYRRTSKDKDALTEYEERFIGFNQPIYRAVWKLPLFD